MNKIIRITLMTLFSVLICSMAIAQENPSETFTIDLTEPDSPATVDIKWQVEGDVTVMGYDGNTVEIEITDRQGSSYRNRQSWKRRTDSAGLKRIAVGGNKLIIQENRNLVNIKYRYGSIYADAVIKVPKSSSLYVHTIEDGNIYIENVDGDIDVKCNDGEVVELKGVSGSIIANALDGDIFATFNSVNSDKPMMFKSLDGVIDLTFPQDLKATFNITAIEGSLYTDFDMDLNSEWVKKDHRSGYQMSRVSKGTINGGGAEITLYALDDDIILRKKK
ncbi:MAG: DUF4097 domain-containing protein [bacterium]|nr:DUF4097 domain-containing protein [bacterium]